MKSSTFKTSRIKFVYLEKTKYCPTCSGALPLLPVLYPVNEEPILQEASSALHDLSNTFIPETYPYGEASNYSEITPSSKTHPEWQNFLHFLRGW